MNTISLRFLGIILKVLKTWGLCVDFIKHREGGRVFNQVFLLFPLQKLEEVGWVWRNKISRQSWIKQGEKLDFVQEFGLRSSESYVLYCRLFIDKFIYFDSKGRLCLCLVYLVVPYIWHLRDPLVSNRSNIYTENESVSAKAYGIWHLLHITFFK